jgi:GNAT superfamily N-acetyltransferase
MAGEEPPAPPIVRAARPQDVPLLLALFRELADYEQLAHEVRATEELLSEALFGERPAAEALIAERGSEAAGYALFFPTFSSFLTIQGVWLEDLFVRPAHRRAGVGKALLAAVAARVRARRRAAGMGGARLERAGARLLQGDRRADDGRMDHPPADRRAPAAPGRGNRGQPGRRAPVAFSRSHRQRDGRRPRSPMDKTTAS